MLGECGLILRRVLIQNVKCSNSSFGLEFVRWRRKPRWLPVAKSKMFRIPERPVQTLEEKEELKRLHNNYKTQMRSLRSYLQEATMRMQHITTADHVVLTPEEEQQEFKRCMLLNENWNREIAEERNARLTKERAERAAYIKERLEAAKLREEEELEHMEAIVRKEKELSKTFITRENLEAAIEQALANPTDFNFSIDLQGNIYHGRNTTPNTAVENEKSAMPLTAKN